VEDVIEALMNGKVLIQLNDIRKTFPLGDERVEILKGINLEIQEGEFVAITGPSGSGKSTLMNVVGLLDRPDTGTYLLDGIETSGMKEAALAEARRSKLGFVFQQFQLLPRLNATENVGLPLLYSQRQWELAPARELLMKVGLGERLEHRPGQLSGGQQQRVAIARALVNRPRIILADEPTGNLDSNSSREILELLKQLNQEGITVILITHDPQVAQSARRIITILDGKIATDSGPDSTRHRTGDKLQDHPGPRTPVPAPGPRGPYLELMRQAIRTLAANPLRTILSTLGVLIGVAAVIAMLAIGKGARESIETQLSSLGSNLISVRPGNVRVGGVTTESDWLKLTREDTRAIAEKIPMVRSATPVVTGNGQRVAFQDRNASTQVYGVIPGYARMHAVEPTIGRYFTEEENQERALVAVIGLTVSRNLFGGDNPVGKTLKLNRIPVRVIGLLPEKGASSFGDRDDQIHIPLHTAMYRVLGKQWVDLIEVEIEKGANMEEAQSRLKDLLYDRHEIPKSQTEDAFRIFNMADIQNALTQTSKTLGTLLIAIASIALLVGGIGIMNIMLVSVTERTREIGLRKAIGATSGDILLQFLVESAAIGVFGGILGISLGVGVSLLISSLAGWVTSISIPGVLGAFWFSSLVGMLFGIWPARRAAGLHPIDALRGE
jgi:macrolide transport system ATP-binding/permease protein